MQLTILGQKCFVFGQLYAITFIGAFIWFVKFIISQTPVWFEMFEQIIVVIIMQSGSENVFQEIYNQVVN